MLLQRKTLSIDEAHIVHLTEAKTCGKLCFQCMSPLKKAEQKMKNQRIHHWLVVSTHLKNMLIKLETFPQIGVKIKNIWNHHPDQF